MAARGEAQADVEVSTLVVPAWRLRWRAPELALVLGERAVALASTRRDEIDRLRAESLVIFASNRMGRGVRIADRALDALRASEKAKEQETSWRLRIELAACATAVGAPLTGFGAVRPVLAAEGVPLSLRAAALVQASDCLVTIGRGPQLGMALSEADQLYVADTLVDPDTRLLQRGLLHASAAAQHRRWGDLQAATDAAGKGLELLAKLGDPTVDSGQVRAKLTLELVCALMDSNRLGEASEVGSPLLDLPVRAPSAGDVGWLRLALATRVHLPAGRVDLARGMLRDAADSAQRHQLDTLLAESLLALAHVHEVSGDLAEALTDLRSAHAAERRRARAVYAVRARLAAEFSGAHRQPVGPHEQLGSLLRPGDGRTSSAQGAMRGSQPPADAVLAPELKQQLRQWRPAPPPKQEGVRIKRALRAAEDMTVEGISAARAHAADRWRLVQPFGATAPDTADPTAEPSAGGRRRAEDRDSAATDLPTTPEQGAESAVPATGLIAAAGAMRSGRRRAAREAADDDTTSTQPPAPTVPSAPWAAGRPAPEPPNDQPDTTPEVANVLDTLKAAGLMDNHRSGGRRRAPDAENDQSGPQHPADSSASTSRSDSRYESSHPADSSPAASGPGHQTAARYQPSPPGDPSTAAPWAGREDLSSQQSAAAQSHSQYESAHQRGDSSTAPPLAGHEGVSPQQSAAGRHGDSPATASGVGRDVESRYESSPQAVDLSALAAQTGHQSESRYESSQQHGDPSTTAGREGESFRQAAQPGSRYESPHPEDSSAGLSEAGRQAESRPEPSQPAPEAPKWRVEPPQRLRSEDDQPKPSDLFDAPTTVQPAVGADGLPVERPSTGLGAAFVKGPVIPTARAPQSPSTVEPPRSPESPRSAPRTTSDPTTAGDRPADAPHIGPDFHLGADSLGRSGFRPASQQPTAPGADPASHPRNTGPADPQGPPSQNSPSSDFRLSADSFGRDGFRTAGPGADPAPTTPHDWPPAPGSSASPQGAPDWSHRGTPDHGASLDLTRGSGSRTPGRAESGTPADLQSSAQSPDWSADAKPGRDSGGAPDNGHQSDPTLGAEPRTPDWAAGHRADSPDWAANDSTAIGGGTDTGGWPNPSHGSGSPAQGWAGGGSRAAEWTSGVPRPNDGYPDTGPGGSRPSEPSAHGGGSQPGFGDSPNWATAGPTTPPSDTPGSQTRPGSAPDTRHQGTETDSQRASGTGDGFGQPDHRAGHPDENRSSDADYAYGVETAAQRPAGDGGGFGHPDHGLGHQQPGRPSSADYPHGVEPGAQRSGNGDGPGRGDHAHGVESDSRRASGNDGGFGQSDDGLGRGDDAYGVESDARRASGNGDGFGQSDGLGRGDDVYGVETDSQRASGNGDGFGRSDHGPGHHEPGRPSSADFTSEFDSEQPGRASASDASGWASGASPDWAAEFTPSSADPGAGSDYSFDTDYSHVRVPDSLTIPQPPNDPTPDHEPDQVPAIPEPDQIPPIPDLDPIPQPAPIPMPPTSSGFDLGRSRFLTSADVEDDLPELPRRVPAESPPVEPPDPFVTAVVVGDRTIEVPSAARASRRHKSDLSLAELLTEALVAYETGRRSDPDADGTASEEIADWISSAETPVSPISPDRLERAGHHVAEPEQPPVREPGANPRPSADPTDSEKTTYLTPVRDVESTAPIWETGPDGDSLPPYDSWTLPES